jgi:hypothetical protein
MFNAVKTSNSITVVIIQLLLLRYEASYEALCPVALFRMQDNGQSPKAQ